MLNISNAKMSDASPVYREKIAKDMDIDEITKDLFITPLLQPLNSNQNVIMTNNKTPVDEDTIQQTLLRCLGDSFDAPAESFMKEYFSQTLTDYKKSTTLNIQELFLVQSAIKENLAEPTNTIIYTPAVDVIPSCRQFIAGTGSFDKLFASLGFFARPNTLGFYFVTESAFDDFKTYINTQVTTLAPTLSSETLQMFNDFQKLKLDGLTESLVLRAKNSQGAEDMAYSFARTLVFLLMSYTAQVSNAEFGVMPFNVGELIRPNSIVFINLERHAKANTREIKHEWDIITKSLQNKPNIISNNKLCKLTATARNAQKIMANAAMMSANINKGSGRSKINHFSTKQPSTVNMARIIKKILHNMAFVNTSMNTFKTTKMSFAKPNRRNPDDFNRQGKVVSTKYYPDIHVYVDTSGSISEEDYENAIRSLIAMAKKLNIGLYFNSFSSHLSQTTKLKLAGKSTKRIYAEFQKIPKVTGGTDYAQIWNFINSSKKRKEELSLIITDFEWTAPSEYIEHPKNLYYAPCDNQNWTYLTSYANEFAKSCIHNDPDIRKHILF